MKRNSFWEAVYKPHNTETDEDGSITPFGMFVIFQMLLLLILFIGPVACKRSNEQIKPIPPTSQNRDGYTILRFELAKEWQPLSEFLNDAEKSFKMEDVIAIVPIYEGSKHTNLVAYEVLVWQH